MVRDYAIFLWRLYRYSFLGSMKYYVWMSILTILTLVGVHAYAEQAVSGLAITGMTIRETGEYRRGARFEIRVPEGAWRITGTK